MSTLSSLSPSLPLSGLDATRSSPPSHLGISGALDCQVNIWDLESGEPWLAQYLSDLILFHFQWSVHVAKSCVGAYSSR